MKKINLIMPILATTGVAGMVAPLASCGSNTKSDREISVDDSESANVTLSSTTTSGGNIEITLTAKVTTKIVASIASVKIGNTVLESSQYTFDASTGKITITKTVLDANPGNIIVKPVLEAKREVSIDTTVSEASLTWKITSEGNIEITLVSTVATKKVKSIEFVKIAGNPLDSHDYGFDASTGKLTIGRTVLAQNQGNIVVKPVLEVVSVEPLHFESEDTITMSFVNNKLNWTGEEGCKLEYSTDGTNWNVWNEETGTISSGNIYLRGTGITSFAQGALSEDDQTNFSLTTPMSTAVDIDGDIRALLNYEDTSKIEIGDFCFCGLFRNCTSLETSFLPDLSKLPKLSDSCFTEMFKGCTGLTAVPVGYLPFGDNGVDLKQYCYMGMFEDCTNLITLPTDLLPSETLAEGCYQCMFKGCTNLQNAPTLPAPELANYCYDSMFQNCTNLKISNTEPTGAQSYGRVFECPRLESTSEAVNDMFAGTSGTYTSGTPEEGVVYYWYTEQITEMEYTSESEHPGSQEVAWCFISAADNFAAETTYKFEYTLNSHNEFKNLAVVDSDGRQTPIGLSANHIELVSLKDQNGSGIEFNLYNDSYYSYELPQSITKVTAEIKFTNAMENICVVAFYDE